MTPAPARWSAPGPRALAGGDRNARRATERRLVRDGRGPGATAGGAARPGAVRGPGRGGAAVAGLVQLAAGHGAQADDPPDPPAAAAGPWDDHRPAGGLVRDGPAGAVRGIRGRHGHLGWRSRRPAAGPGPPGHRAAPGAAG